MPRGVFRDLMITSPPKVEDPTLARWLDQTVRELQRFAKDISYFLVQDIAVARVSTQKLVAGFQIMSDGLFVEILSDAAVTSNTTKAFRPGVLGSWLIIQNIGAFPITIKNGAGTVLGTGGGGGGGDEILGTNSILTVRYDGTNWVKISEAHN
jgi:hypothetical protein